MLRGGWLYLTTRSLNSCRNITHFDLHHHGLTVLHPLYIHKLFALNLDSSFSLESGTPLHFCSRNILINGALEPYKIYDPDVCWPPVRGDPLARKFASSQECSNTRTCTTYHILSSLVVPRRASTGPVSALFKRHVLFPAVPYPVHKSGAHTEGFTLLVSCVKLLSHFTDTVST